MVLSYPESGVLPVSDTTSRRIGNDFSMLHKHFRKSFAIDRWTVDKVQGTYDDEDRFNDEEYRTRLERLYGYLGDNYNQPCQSKLALLLTNKQIYEEAMPFFYRVNNFMFTNVDHLDNKLRSMPAERREHLRSIAFSYVPADILLAPKTFQLLATIPRLHKLYIDIDEDSWTRMEKFEDRDRNLLDIAGLHDLRGILGLQQVEFSSRCTVIAVQLKSTMENSDRSGGEQGSTDVELVNGDNDAGREVECAVINEGSEFDGLWMMSRAEASWLDSM